MARTYGILERAQRLGIGREASDATLQTVPAKMKVALLFHILGAMHLA